VNSIRHFTGVDNDNIIEVHGNKEHEMIEIPPRHFDNIEQIISLINENFRKLSYINAVLIFNKESKRVKLTFDHKCKIKISEKLSDILGFDGKTLFHQDKDDPTQNLKSHHIGKFPPDVHGGKYHIFLYTDIIQPQVVGSSLVPMLRMINIRGDDGEAVTDVFQTPYYMELSRNTIENITIVVCDEFGNEIPFDKGIFTTTLHFRRIPQ
jgi:hypothetical protein